jgi:hypothetical protein
MSSYAFVIMGTSNKWIPNESMGWIHIMRKVCYYEITNVGLVYSLYLDINLGINMNMKIFDQSNMVCSSYCGWNHIAVVCENWIYFDSYPI